MNELQIFNHEEFGEIRTIEIDGQIYFVGIDVAKALGYNPAKYAVRDHVDKEDKMILPKKYFDELLKSESVKFQSGYFAHFENIPNRGLTVINESGFYSLVLASELPGARKFQHWVTSEVLPSIRRTGTYSTLSVEETFNKALDERIRTVVDIVLDEKIEATVNKVLDEKIEGIIKTAVNEAVEKAVSETVKVLAPYMKTPDTQPLRIEDKPLRKARSYKKGKMFSLPPELKQQVDEMIISGEYSCQQILDFITENSGIKMSYMTVSRYIKKYFIIQT